MSGQEERDLWQERVYRQDCEHHDFHARVAVNRIEDIHAFAADVAIECAECGRKFIFLGLPAGVSIYIPTVSIDSTEARLPIAPEELI